MFIRIATPFLLAVSASGQTIGGSYDTVYQLDGLAAYDSFGEIVAAAGDVNQDGFDDLIVGARLADPGGRTDAGSAFVFSGADGSLIYQWNGASAQSNFGFAVSGAGDVNADGFDDLIVGAPRTNPGGNFDAGSVYVYSGADGSQLYRWNGNAASELLGMSVAAALDINSDGFDDLIAGAPLSSPGGVTFAGAVYIYSGADGSLLIEKGGKNVDDRFGKSVAGGADLNQDGYPDLIIGAPKTDRAAEADVGSIYIYSGLDGALLRHIVGQDQDDFFGYSVSSAGDVNVDGYPDLIVGAYKADPLGNDNAGAAYVYSGANSSLLYQWNGQAASDSFGLAVSGAGDVNGDGYSDLIVGAYRASPDGIHGAGSAYLYSGVDGSLFHQWNGAKRHEFLGLSLAGAGNVNGDGLEDVIIGVPNQNQNGLKDAGAVFVYSFNPFLRASDEQISISTGGSIDYQLDFPDQTAGYHYKVLASNSGSGPTLFGIEIPLTEDDLVLRSWMGRYPGAAAGNLQGTLDAEGKATATIRIAAGNWTELIGRNFHLAAVAIPSFGPPEYSSIAVPLSIIP
jgi:FG-GAP repeat protein